MLRSLKSRVRQSASTGIEFAKTVGRHVALFVDDFVRSREIIVYVERRTNGLIQFRFHDMIDTDHQYHWMDPTTLTLHLVEEFGRLERRLERLGCESITPEISASLPHEPWDTLTLRFPSNFRAWDEVEDAVYAFTRGYFEKRVSPRKW